MSIGSHIRAVRESKGMRQVDAAHKAHISQAEWSRFEHGGRIPSVGSLKKIAKALNENLITFLED